MHNSRIDNISDVFQLIQNHEKEHTKKFRFYNNTLQKILLFISICSFCIFVIFIFSIINPYIPPNIFYIVTFIIVSNIFIVSAVLYLILRYFFPEGKNIFKPIATYLEQIQKEIEAESDLIKKLADVDISILEQTIKRLGYEIERLEGRRTEITGLFQKYGIIPAAVALYIVFAKKDILIGEYLITFLQISFVFFISTLVGAIIVQAPIERLKMYSFIIESAKNKAGLKSVLQNM